MLKNTLKLIELIIFLFLMACTPSNLNIPATQLSQSLSKSPVRLETTFSGVKITILTDHMFQEKTMHLSYSMQNILSSIAQTLENYPDLKINIIGYTDNVHSSRTNYLVALRRAMMIADYFRNHGINSNRISVHGLGEKDPIASNASAAGRMKNRRVEIILS